MARDTLSRCGSLEQVLLSRRVWIVAGKASRLCGRMGMLKVELCLDLGVAGKAELLRLLFQEGLVPTVVAGMAGLALALPRK